MAEFRLTTPSLASNCWPALPQTLVNEMFDKTRGVIEDLEGVIISQSQPAIDDQNKAWFRIDGSGRENGYFLFIAGQWVRRNQEEASGNARRLFVGTEVQVWSYDGGDGTDPSIATPTPTTGAMWEVDHDFDGRSPMGPGVIPDSSPAINLANSANAGSAVTTQTADQVAPHTHPLSADSSIENGDNIKVVTAPGSGGSGLQIGGSGNASTDLSVLANEYTGASQEAMPILHPVRGSYVIKRTLRTHYVA